MRGLDVRAPETRAARWKQKLEAPKRDAVDRLKLYDWLAECTGETIWSREYCQRRGLPVSLIDRLVDATESGFEREDQTVYYEGRLVNQFEGIRDVDLALWIAGQLGVSTTSILESCPDRRSVVRAIQEAVEEG